MNENAVAQRIVDAPYRIHTTLGPGLLESVNEAVLACELTKRGLGLTRRQPIPVICESVRIDTGYRADLIVEDKVIVEIKSVEAIARVHKKQLLTYLKLGRQTPRPPDQLPVALIKNGITRIVNGLQDDNTLLAP